ncbi:MAG: hypothetical protein ABJ360_23270 [Roseobacter sp.]
MWLWTGICYTFLSQNKTNPKYDFDLANVDVYPWGLLVDESVSEEIATATMARFWENHLGSLH